MENKPRIWIVNHNATPPSMGVFVRHYYFAKYIQPQGYDIKIFTASAIHNTNTNTIQDNALYKEQAFEGIPYVFVRTRSFQGNGFDRILNMLEFPLRLWKVCKHFERPDVIYASSPDIFAAYQAMRIAKRLRVPFIFEVRDLWPESIVEYRQMSRKNPLIRLLYRIEKKLYRTADRIVFTMPGGKDYIRDRGWDAEIDLNKVYNINNGVDLEEFDRNAELYPANDEDLNDPDSFKVVYTGSIRLVNDIEKLVDVAKLLHLQDDSIKLLLWGGGNCVDQIRGKIQREGLQNIVLKGTVNKCAVPGILKKADVTLVHWKQSELMQYGFSPNKLFEYFAAAKPIVCTLALGKYDFITEGGCGCTLEAQSAEDIAGAITRFARMSREERAAYGTNARKTAAAYDFAVLAERFADIVERSIGSYSR